MLGKNLHAQACWKHTVPKDNINWAFIGLAEMMFWDVRFQIEKQLRLYKEEITYGEIKGSTTS